MWERNEKKFEMGKGDSNKNTVKSLCYHYGMKGHWWHNYHTLKHLVELYQASLQKNEENVEIKFVSECGPSDAQYYLFD